MGSLLIAAIALGAGCQQATDQPNVVTANGLSYTAEARLVDEAPTMLDVSVTLTNETAKTLQVKYGGCSFTHLLMFDNPARSGAPMWDSANRRDPVTGSFFACTSHRVDRELAPDESFSPEELRLLIPTYEIVGHPLLDRFLPDGSYFLAAQVLVNDRVIEIPAGQVALAMKQAPLPSQRISDGLPYRVETGAGSISPPTIEARLTVTNTSNTRLAASVARECPLTVYVYRDLGRRDAAYAAGKADWRPAARCYLEKSVFYLAPEESRQFIVTVTTAEILGHSLPDGRYYMAAVVWLEDRTLLLSAGDVDLQRR